MAASSTDRDAIRTQESWIRQLRLLLKWSPAILAVAALAAFGVHWRSSQVEDRYRSTSVIDLNDAISRSVLLGGTAFTTSGAATAGTEAIRLTSPEAYGEVRQALGESSQFLLWLEAEHVPESSALVIDAVATDPVVASEAVAILTDTYVADRTAEFGAALGRELAVITEQRDSRISDLAAITAQINALTASGTGSQDDLNLLRTESGQIQLRVSQLQATMEDLDLGLRLLEVDSVVVAAPTVPGAPFYPTAIRDAELAAALVAVLALGLVIGVGYFTDRVRTPTDLERLAPDVPTFARIARLPGGRRAKSSRLTDDPTGLAGFRAVRASLELQLISTSGAAKAHTIGFTSIYPGEGKTTTALHVASSFAKAGTRTLLIEGDLYRPAITPRSWRQKRLGLADIARAAGKTTQIDFDDYLQVLSTGDGESITTMPAGIVDADTPELLTRPVVTKILERAVEDFDIVIVDMPPLLGVMDGVLMASAVDELVVVVESGRHTFRRYARDVNEGLGAGVSVSGFVLNKAKRRDVSYYRDYLHEDSEDDQRPVPAATL